MQMGPQWAYQNTSDMNYNIPSKGQNRPKTSIRNNLDYDTKIYRLYVESQMRKKGKNVEMLKISL